MTKVKIIRFKVNLIQTSKCDGHVRKVSVDGLY